MTGDDRDRPGSATVSLADDSASGASPSDGDFPLVARERYAVGEEFARGGGGRLLRARDLRLDRVVAIKEPLSLSSRIERRFLREAMLTARLQHPSIVPVHEIGRWPTGEPFYAMKLVSGRSLRDVVAETATIEQRVALVPSVLAVADAIAYAHGQGVIHRDLKSSNVMVGDFGETQVIDWGLAKELRDPDDGVRGTPATMAPEQATGKPVDERTDVYGIGALLYEVLAGSTPYAGESASTVIARVSVEPPPRLVDREPLAPRDLIAISERAMARDPADRYPSARELADDLRRFLSGQLVRARRYSYGWRLWRVVRRNRRVLIAVAASLVLGTTGALVTAQARTTRVPVCEGAERELARVWGPAQKAAIVQALVASGKPWADETASMVTGELDRYSREWVGMHREACEATSVRHEQSEVLLDLRMQCLGDRLDEMRELTTLLSIPDDSLLASASKAVYAITPLRGCADARALLAPVPLPVDPVARGEVDSIRAALAKVKALNEFGRYSDAAPVAAKLNARAVALHYAPIEAESLEVQGDALEALADYEGSAESYRRALWAAERGLDRARVASAMINLVWEMGVDQGLHAQAHEYGAQAAAVLVGLGGDTGLEANLASYEAVVFRDEGRLEDAEKRGREAIDKRKLALGAMHPRYAMALSNLGAIVGDQGRDAEALALIQEAVVINAATLGEHHPDYALSLQNVGGTLNLLGRAPEARPFVEHALAVVEEALGPNHPRVAAAEWLLGKTDTNVGDYAEAERHLRHAVVVAESLLGPDHVYVAEYTGALAETLTREGRSVEAVVLFERSIEILGKDKNARDMSEVQSGLGGALLALGRPAKAVVALQAALDWQDKNLRNVRELARTRFRMARALWAVGGDRERARRLAGMAKEAFEQDPGAQGDFREVVAWVEGHRDATDRR